MKKFAAVGTAFVMLLLTGCAANAGATSAGGDTATPGAAESGGAEPSIIRVVIFDNATDENLLMIEGNCTPVAEPESLTLTCLTGSGESTERTFELAGHLCDSVERLEGEDEYHYLEVVEPETVPAPIGDIEYSCDAKRMRR